MCSERIEAIRKEVASAPNSEKAVMRLMRLVANLVGNVCNRYEATQLSQELVSSSECLSKAVIDAPTDNSSHT